MHNGDAMSSFALHHAGCVSFALVLAAAALLPACGGRVQPVGLGGQDAGVTVCQDNPCVTTLATDLDGFSALAADGNNVYWTRPDTPGQGAVMKVPVAGGAPSLVASTASFGESFGIALDANHVYSAGTDGYVFAAPISGPPAATVLATTYHDAWGIAVDAANVYWGTADFPGYILKAPLAGGEPTVLATATNSPRKVLVDDANVYWIGGPGAVVVSVPKSGGMPVTLATSTITGGDMVLVGDRIYWINYPGTAIFETPVGGGPTTTFASGFQMAWYIATDGRAIYVSDFDAGTIDKLPLDGGPMVTLASGVGGPSLIAADDTSVYFEANTSLMKLTPK